MVKGHFSICLCWVWLRFEVAADSALGVFVRCVLGGGVLVEKAFPCQWLRAPWWVVGEGAVYLTDPGDGALAGVSHGTVGVWYGPVGQLMACVALMLLGDALVSVGVPLLQVCPDMGNLLSAFLYVVAGPGGCLCGGGSTGVASHARGHEAYFPGPWVLGRPHLGGVVGRRKRQQRCAWR